MRFDTEAMPRTPMIPKQPGSGRLGRRLALALVILSLLDPAVAVAKDSAARKLGRGFANLGLGVLAIPSQVIETTRKSGPTVVSVEATLREAAPARSANTPDAAGRRASR